MRFQRPLLFFFFAALIASAGHVAAQPQARDLPDKLLVGYWHNWAGYPLTLRLSEISTAFDVVDIAFATPTVPSGSTLRFEPDPSIYPTREAFIADVQLLQSLGKKVLISIGGAADPVVVDDPGDVADFVASMSEILDLYGFDGVDVDLEGASLSLDPGDDDFRAPTSPRIVHFIEALTTLMDLYPDHLLSAAPETAYVQGAYQTYGGIWGAYLPVIHALRERWSFIHVQHYNTGSMYGRDGNIYEPATADFHVAMADMLLAGFTVDVWGRAIEFPPLGQDQIAIGLPAGDQAGGGYTPPELVHQALDYLILGIPFGGQYDLASPDGYPGFRGLMTWSINWDAYYGHEFSSVHQNYLDGLATALPDAGPRAAAGSLVLLPSYPSPAVRRLDIRYELRQDTAVRCEILDIRGRVLRETGLQYRTAGEHVLRIDVSDLPAGIYLYRLAAADRLHSGKIVVTR